MVFRHAPIPRKGSGKQQQQQHVAAWQCTTLAQVLQVAQLCKTSCTCVNIFLFLLRNLRGAFGNCFFHCGNYGCGTQCFFTCASFAQNIFA